MGDGHLRVAAQLQRRLTARGDAADVVDILQVIPFKLGPALRGGYSAMLRHAPSVYEAIYRGFFVPRPGSRLRPDPLVAVSAPTVRRLIEAYRPDVVVSTFHLCAQITGRLRATRQLRVPSTVVVTDLVAHRMWLHAGNDAFVCVHPRVAGEASAATGRPAYAAAPAVAAEFLMSDAAEPARPRMRAQLRIPVRMPAVVVSAGAWGSGDVIETVAAVASDNHVAVVLCGRNRRLRHALDTQGLPNLVTLGWRDDLPAVMRACDVLVENAAGQTAMEALAVGLPVVTDRPLAGHGRDGARRMAELGLSSFAAGDAQLGQLIDELASADSSRRRDQVAAGRALFSADPVEFLDPAAVPGRRGALPR
jgi:UDP-N-acetylglucosamine:LPS N-acetylglucosamine transferase